MELLSKEILDQIRAAKAAREAATAELVAKVETEDDGNFDPIRDIEADADPEIERMGRGLWKPSW